MRPKRADFAALTPRPCRGPRPLSTWSSQVGALPTYRTKPRPDTGSLTVDCCFYVGMRRPRGGSSPHSVAPCSPAHRVSQKGRRRQAGPASTVGIASDALASMLVLRWNAQATRRVEPTQRSVPVVKTEVQTGVSPELSVRRGREAVEFYKAALGAVEIYRVGGTEQNEDVVAQLSV